MLNKDQLTNRPLFSYPTGMSLMLILGLAILFAAVVSEAGTRPQASVKRISKKSRIAIDGILKEPCWNKKNLIIDLDPEKAVGNPPFEGIINGPNDLSAKCYAVWDKDFLYLGIERKDDVNQYEPKKTLNSWEYDDIELFITKDPISVNNDFSAPLFGDSGYQVIICMNESPSESLLISSAFSNAGEVWTIEQLQKDGFEYVCKKTKGASFQCEIKIAWSGVFCQISPAVGKEIGFSLGISDNDGKGWKAYMKWGGGRPPHSAPDEWGKLVIAK